MDGGDSPANPVVIAPEPDNSANLAMGGVDLGQRSPGGGEVAWCRCLPVSSGRRWRCCWDTIGYAHHHLGHHAEAAACYQRAGQMLDKYGYRYTQAVTLTSAGPAYRAAGDMPAAREAWRQAWPSWRKPPSRHGQGCSPVSATSRRRQRRPRSPGGAGRSGSA